MFCGTNSYNTCSSAVCDIVTSSQLFCHLFVALSMILCSKSTQKFAVRVCQVDTVVMETAQLVLGQFRNFLS